MRVGSPLAKTCSLPISNDKFINRDNNRNSNRNTTAVAITIALATAIANANEHTKIVRITFVWGPRAGIMDLVGDCTYNHDT